MDYREKIIDGRRTGYCISQDFDRTHAHIFLHGWGQEARTFEPLYERLESVGISCLGLDLP